ncbi:GGDEF domain-containing protein [Radicibacter daui]|uniref:GGDEF domain-containing protein n=1 Tax=Radicibacter daui TaxID=3064829 RepID=UPI004046E8B2
MTVHSALKEMTPATGSLLYGTATSERLKDIRKGLGSSLSVLLDRALDLVAEAEQMLADQRSRIAYLESLAMADELSGLLNRRGFNEQFDREIAAARRYDGAAGVLVLIDLDGFKQVNDTKGHLAGDAVLRHAADLLRDNVREADIIARLGGDEFAVVLTRTDERAAAERIRTLTRGLANMQIEWNGEVIEAGASIGYASFASSDSRDEVFALADRHLYADKAARKSMAA